jgi:hypothetical protein
LKIAQLQIVAGYANTPQVQLSLGADLVELQRTEGGQLLTINAPDQAPPQLPRVLLRLADTVLNVALNRIEIVTVPPQHVASNFSAALKFARSRVATFLEPLVGRMPAYEWSGVVAELEFHNARLPHGNTEQMTTSLFDRLTKIERGDRRVTAFQLSFGVRDVELFVGYNIHEFEYRNVRLTGPLRPGERVVVGPDQMKVTDSGINIVVDVNNRTGKSRKGLLVDIDSIFSEQQRRFDSLAQDLNLTEVLK